MFVKKSNFLQVGFVAMFILAMSAVFLAFLRPVQGVSSTGTCLPVSKGGTGVCSAGDFLNLIYPVGSIYTSTDSTNPGTKFGGTWTAYGAGQTLVGVDPGQTEFATVQQTGGQKTHTLTTAQMPNHTHTFTGTINQTTSSSGAHTHTIGINNYPAMHYLNVAAGGGSYGTIVVAGTAGSVPLVAESNGLHQHTITPSGTNANIGGGQAHNNLQPYVTVYFWQRTS